MDRLKGEIDHEQWQEWCAFFALEPHGWQAHRVTAQRISYMTAQAQTKKRLRERDFDIVFGGNVASPEVERARWEAMSVRSEIADGGA